jgi:two-component system, NtrC family, sensor kinase
MKGRVVILCVDDEPNILKTLERFCVNEGFTPHLAASGREALEIMERDAPIHIVISDYRMPEMNGVELLRRIHQGWPGTINILLSGYADIPIVSQAISDRYIHAFLTKPWKRSDLKNTIQTAIDLFHDSAQNRSHPEPTDAKD